jgi:hypothetical protein
VVEAIADAHALGHAFTAHDDVIAALRLPVRDPAMRHLEARHLWFERISRFYQELAEGREVEEP